MKDPLDTKERVETRKAVTGAVVIVLGIAAIIALRPSIWFTVILILGIVLTIMLHEAGHFIAAKRSGMKVTEFFVGFGPRIWSFRKGETEYGIKAIPAGGYVRIIGMNNIEEVDPADEARTYRAATYPKKMVTILAGVTVNLALFVLLTFVVLAARGADVLTTTVDQVTSESPAAQAGLQSGDTIVAIEGQPIDSWEAVGEIVRPRAGESLEVVVDRDGTEQAFDVVPADIGGQGRIGVTSSVGVQRYSVPEAAWESVVWVPRGTEQVIGALGKVFSASGVQRYGETVVDPDDKDAFTAVERPRSVIGIVADGGDLVGNSFYGLLALLASINLFLALFNLIPLLPFDGGHAAVATYEAAASRIRRRKVVVDYRRLMPVTAVVFIALLMFGLSTMYLDIRGIITG